jgi:hypothetical protein
MVMLSGLQQVIPRLQPASRVLVVRLENIPNHQVIQIIKALKVTIIVQQGHLQVQIIILDRKIAGLPLLLIQGRLHPKGLQQLTAGHLNMTIQVLLNPGVRQIITPIGVVNLLVTDRIILIIVRAVQAAIQKADPLVQAAVTRVVHRAQAVVTKVVRRAQAAVTRVVRRAQVAVPRAVLQDHHRDDRYIFSPKILKL